MITKQTITTEEFNSEGKLTRRIVEVSEFKENPFNSPLTMPGPIPGTPNDVPPIGTPQITWSNRTAPAIYHDDGITTAQSVTGGTTNGTAN